MNLRAEVIAETRRLVELNGHGTHAVLVQNAKDVFNGRLMAEVGEALINAWLSKTVRSGMAAALPDGARAQQPSFGDILPGFPVPAVISTQESPDGDVTYVAFEDATWADLDAHEAVLTDNIVNAQRSLYDFKDKRDLLRPYTQPFPQRTVSEAVAMIRKQAQP